MYLRSFRSFTPKVYSRKQVEIAVLMPAGPGVFIAEKRCLVCIRGDEERIWNLTIVNLSEDVANALLVPFFLLSEATNDRAVAKRESSLPSAGS